MTLEEAYRLVLDSANVQFPAHHVPIAELLTAERDDEVATEATSAFDVDPLALLALLRHVGLQLARGECTHPEQYLNDRSQFVCRACGQELGR